ncbi:MAG: ABC transporter ATP-binding protein [Gordonia sp. (in: high G+C Gram-positive bacteria)]
MIRSLFRLGDGRSRRSLAVLLALVSVNSAVVAAILLLMIPVVERLMSPDPSSAWPPVLWTAGLAVVMVVLELMTSMRVSRDARHHIVRMHQLLAEQLTRAPLGYFTADRAGTVAAIASRGVPMAANAPGGLVRTMARGLLSPALCVIGLIVVAPPVGVVAAVGLVVVYAVYRWVHHVNYRIERDVDLTDDEGSARVLEFAQRQPAVRAAGPGSLAEQAVRRSIDEQARVKATSENRRGWGSTAMNLIVYAFLGAAVAVATAQLFGGRLTLGAYAGLLTTMTVLSGMVLRFLPHGRGIELAKIAVADLDAVLSQEPLPEPEASATPVDAGIEFDDVTFGYRDDGDPVLRGLSMTIPAGKTTAIVGPSGSGKSTILRLIARFWDVDSGAVRIGGVDLRDLRERDVADRLSMVFQEVYLFEDDLLENIRLGRPDASDDEVLAAAEAAGVTEIADRLPSGFASSVGEGGSTLSGGERQRLSIARALLKKAPIMLLDEATAALDVENESLVQRTLAESCDGQTRVVVAHRMSFIAGADHIVVLDGAGGVEAQGAHDELLQSSHTYRRFCADRAETARWRVR